MRHSRSSRHPDDADPQSGVASGAKRRAGVAANFLPEIVRRIDPPLEWNTCTFLRIHRPGTGTRAVRSSRWARARLGRCQDAELVQVSQELDGMRPLTLSAKILGAKFAQVL